MENCKLCQQTSEGLIDFEVPRNKIHLVQIIKICGSCFWALDVNDRIEAYNKLDNKKIGVNYGENTSS